MKTTSTTKKSAGFEWYKNYYMFKSRGLAEKQSGASTQNKNYIHNQSNIKHLSSMNEKLQVILKKIDNISDSKANLYSFFNEDHTLDEKTNSKGEEYYSFTDDSTCDGNRIMDATPVLSSSRKLQDSLKNDEISYNDIEYEKSPVYHTLNTKSMRESRIKKEKKKMIVRKTTMASFSSTIKKYKTNESVRKETNSKNIQSSIQEAKSKICQKYIRTKCKSKESSSSNTIRSMKFTQDKMQTRNHHLVQNQKENCGNLEVKRKLTECISEYFTGDKKRELCNDKQSLNKTSMRLSREGLFHKESKCSQSINQTLNRSSTSSIIRNHSSDKYEYLNKIKRQYSGSRYSTLQNSETNNKSNIKAQKTVKFESIPKALIIKYAKPSAAVYHNLNLDFPSAQNSPSVHTKVNSSLRFAKKSNKFNIL